MPDVTWGTRNRPAPTVTGGGGKASGIEIFDQQSRHKMLAQIKEGTMNGNDRPVNSATPLDPIRVTVQEAATLQSIPTDFIWEAQYEHTNAKTGKRTMKPVPNTKKFLIVGNAEPPLLAERVLEALWAVPESAAISAESLGLAA